MSTSPTQRVRLTSIRLPKAADVLASQIKEDIISGNYPVGSMLPHEKEMASQLNISRPTVREALRLLESEGLVSIRPGPRGGPRVERPNVETVTRSLTTLFQYERVTLAELLEARRAIEPACAEVAARQADDSDIALLRRSVETMEAKLDDEAVFWSENANFHLALVNAGRNTVLRTLMEALRDLLYQFTSDMHIESDDRADTLDAHRAIMEAIAAHDPERAYQAALAHLENSEARFREQYRGPMAVGFNRGRRPDGSPTNQQKADESALSDDGGTQDAKPE
jgi:GntR family transcriptional regulator, transcriptional repressor for pyruvate dehydrogenase complex